MTGPRRAAQLALASVVMITAALTAQDRSTIKVPDGLSLSVFAGYEGWQVIAPSETDHGIKPSSATRS